ncbi:MAG: hypothetical protein GY777_16805, partial [Candidatus Brocadiaceae bacterium]|nr:hypothetical protein [Candidatus Brocadiaceae bacterium]
SANESLHSIARSAASNAIEVESEITLDCSVNAIDFNAASLPLLLATHYLTAFSRFKDCHPGNLVMIPDGRIVFTDTEQMRKDADESDLNKNLTSLGRGSSCLLAQCFKITRHANVPHILNRR